MNCIGIIGAMEEEVACLKEQMKEVKVTAKAGMEFYQGLLGGKSVVVVRSGIGKVNAAVCTQILADDFKVDGVINTGIAGSLKNEVDIGDIVLSTDVIQHDVDARDFGYPKGQIPRMELLAFPADEKLRETAKRVCERVNPQIKVYCGRVASGDQFISSHEVKERIKEDFAPYCVEMEGAAIGQCAYLNGIPFLIVRAISDKADNSATMDYPAFEKQAIAHCVNLTENMVKEL
ncbi:MAG: 5'-methylthioadenosine/adenosylhomocysteine nucleosidase [Blautia sp.]|jgi:adenosylhomocysteine nucleosidase